MITEEEEEKEEKIAGPRTIKFLKGINMENSTDEQLNINIDLEQTEAGVKCDECKSHQVFNHGFMLRKVSAVLSPSGEEGYDTNSSI